MGDILVYAEDPDHAFELLGKARDLAGSLGGNVVYAALGAQATRAQDFVAHGASRVLTHDHELLNPFQVEVYTEAFHQLIQTVRPTLVLLGAAIRTKDAAARVATRLEVGVGADQSNLRLEGGRLVGDRNYFSGNSIATEQLLKDPQIVLVSARAYMAPAPDSTKTGTIEPADLTFAPPKARLVKREAKTEPGVNLEDASIVVSAGRGIKKQEDLAMVEELAKAIGGVVGCTRPIAADLKWLSDAHWIGLSGHEVKPKVYIGLGVSGQIQHVAGMRGSKLIVAINKDEEAPLVKISDYAIVDDLYKVLPALIREVRKLRDATQSAR